MSPPDTDRLLRTIKEVAARVEKYRPTAFNEQMTKASLIEPILDALGWDTRDPEQVRREFRFDPKDNPVDYALQLASAPKLMVEAKGLNEDLDDRRWVGQTIGYAAVGGALWCVLTNGDEWRIYNATAAVQAGEKMLCRLVLSAEPAGHTARMLSLISRPNMADNLIETLWKARNVDGRVQAVLARMLGGPTAAADPKFVRLVRSAEPSLSAREVADALRRLDVRVEQPPIQLPARPPKSNPPARAPKPPPPVAPAATITRAPPGRKLRPAPKQHTARPADLFAAGLLTPPVRLFCKYRKVLLEAALMPDGQVEFAGSQYASVSTAASAARATLTGRPMTTNGWVFWRCEVAGTRQTLEAVRAEFVRRKRRP